MKFFNKRQSLKTIVSDDGSKASRQIRVDEKELGGSFDTKRTVNTMSTTGSSEASSKVDVVDFVISIESIDGIISTNTGRQSNIGQLGIPVFGVVSYNKRLNNGKVAKTNIPSMSLVKSTSSIGNRDRYHAGFGYPKGNSNILEQIHLALPMNVNRINRSEYVRKSFNLTINLMRGSEVMKIGCTSLLLNGDENGESKLIPIGQEKSVRTTRVRGKKRISKKSKTTVGARSASFVNDPSRKYSLQRANIRVSVVAINRVESTTSKYTKQEDEIPITNLVSTDKSSDSVSLISGVGGSQLYPEASNDDSLLRKVSAISLSSSEDSAYTSNLKYSNFLANDRNASLDESDFETTYTEDEDNLAKLHFINFQESSEDTDNESLLDDVSLGTIQFQGLGSASGSVLSAEDDKRTGGNIMEDIKNIPGRFQISSYL